MILLDVAAALLGAALVFSSLVDLFVSVVVPRSVGWRFRASAVLSRYGWRVWRHGAMRIGDQERREDTLAVFAPTPKASVKTTTALKPGRRANRLDLGFCRCSLWYSHSGLSWNRGFRRRWRRGLAGCPTLGTRRNRIERGKFHSLLRHRNAGGCKKAQ